MGGYIRLDLIGKITRQPGDELFYSVLKTVYVKGIPVGKYNIYRLPFLWRVSQSSTVLSSLPSSLGRIRPNSVLQDSLVTFATSKKGFIDYLIKEIGAESDVSKKLSALYLQYSELIAQNLHAEFSNSGSSASISHFLEIQKELLGLVKTILSGVLNESLIVEEKKQNIINNVVKLLGVGEYEAAAKLVVTAEVVSTFYLH